MAANGSFRSFADRAAGAVLIWSATGLETASGPVNMTVTFADVDFTDGAVGDVSVGSCRQRCREWDQSCAEGRTWCSVAPLIQMTGTL